MECQTGLQVKMFKKEINSSGQFYVLLFLSILVIEEADGVLESVDGGDLPGELPEERSLPHNVLRHPE